MILKYVSGFVGGMKPMHGMQAHASSPYLSKKAKPNVNSLCFCLL
jgi:hypothetical protein